jgi:oligopeptide transport system substrate-binding protein
LAEAGYPEGRGFPKIELRIMPVVAERLQAFFDSRLRETLGVEVTAMPNPHGYQPPSQWGSARMSAGSAAAYYVDPDSVLRFALRRVTNWRHAEYDRLVEQARRSMDQTLRLQLYAKAQQILVDEAPLIVGHYTHADVLVKPWVKGLAFHPLGGMIFKDVIIEPH